MDIEAASKISVFNDLYRKTSTNFMITKGVMDLGNTDAVIDLVRRFDNFSQSNDPYGEHDFGGFSFDGEDIYWKIDYYDQECKYGKDPLDPDCNRVLTVLLATEY